MMFKLHRPLTAGPRRIDVLEIREPSAAEVVRLFNKNAPADDFTQMLRAIAACTGEDMKVLEQLSARDFLQLTETVGKIFIEATNG